MSYASLRPQATVSLFLFLFLFLALLFGAALPAAAAPPAAWSVAVQQDGMSSASDAPVTMKRAPFQLVFRGPKTMAYVVVASAQCDELAAVNTAEAMAEIVGPRKVASEASNRADRTLLLNKSGTVRGLTNTQQVWTEDKDNELFAFQRFTVAPDGSAIAVREIRDILQLPAAAQARATPIQATRLSQLCALVAGLPPAGHLAPTAPTLVRLKFE